MFRIAGKDFCVATSWSSDQVSIASACVRRGRIFKLTNDYESIIMSDGLEFKITELTYHNIFKYLPFYYGEQFHCSFDDS